jgi:hypothetical protein
MVKNTQSKALLHRTNKGAPSFGSARNTYKVKQKQNFFHYFLPSFAGPTFFITPLGCSLQSKAGAPPPGGVVRSKEILRAGNQQGDSSLQKEENLFCLFSKFSKSDSISDRQYNKNIPNLLWDIPENKEYLSSHLNREPFFITPYQNSFFFFKGLIPLLLRSPRGPFFFLIPKGRVQKFYALSLPPQEEREADFDFKAYGAALQCYKSGDLYKEIGAAKQPLYLPVEAGYNHLITYPMYCVLIGLLISDGSINAGGNMVINLTNRWRSGVDFSLFLINLLAPIIQSVDLHDGSLEKKYIISMKNYKNKDGSLNKEKLIQDLEGLITKIRNEPKITCKKKNKNKPNKAKKKSNNIRITTLPIFSLWRKIFYEYDDLKTSTPLTK